MSRGGCYINLNHSFSDFRDSLFLFRSISSRKETRTSRGYLFYAKSQSLHHRILFLQISLRSRSNKIELNTMDSVR